MRTSSPLRFSDGILETNCIWFEPIVWTHLYAERTLQEIVWSFSQRTLGPLDVPQQYTLEAVSSMSDGSAVEGEGMMGGATASTSAMQRSSGGVAGYLSALSSMEKPPIGSLAAAKALDPLEESREYAPLPLTSHQQHATITSMNSRHRPHPSPATSASAMTTAAAAAAAAAPAPAPATATDVMSPLGQCSQALGLLHFVRTVAWKRWTDPSFPELLDGYRATSKQLYACIRGMGLYLMGKKILKEATIHLEQGRQPQKLNMALGMLLEATQIWPHDRDILHAFRADALQLILQHMGHRAFVQRKLPLAFQIARVWVTYLGKEPKQERVTTNLMTMCTHVGENVRWNQPLDSVVDVLGWIPALQERLFVKGTSPMKHCPSLRWKMMKRN